LREVICIRRQDILPIVAYVAEKYAPNLCSGNDGQLVTILLQLQLMGVKNDDLPEAVPLGELRSCMRAVNVPPSQVPTESPMYSRCSLIFRCG
jgi:hypothetical protein